MSIDMLVLRWWVSASVVMRLVHKESSINSHRPICCEGSRWVNNAILKSDKYRKIKVSNNKIFVDGLFRTDIDPLFIGNALREPHACADIAPRSWQDDGYACATRKDKVDDECTKDSVWKEDLYCEQTCFDVGLGYEACLPNRCYQTVTKSHEQLMSISFLPVYRLKCWEDENSEVWNSKLDSN